MNIKGQDKVALIDTGAGRCCMNVEQYQNLGSPPLEPADMGFWLRTASWSPNARDGFPYMQPTNRWRNLQTAIHCLLTVDSWNYIGT